MSPYIRVFLMLVACFLLLMGSCLIGIGAYLANATNMSANAVALAILGSFIVLVSLFGFLGAKKERNWMLLCYFYFHLILVLLLLFFSTTAIFLQDTFKFYIKHSWTSPELQFLRSKSCCSTYDSAIIYLDKWFTIIGIIGYVSFALVLIAMYYTVRLLTIPIIMRNILTIINIMFVIAGSLVIFFGAVIHRDGMSETEKPWIAYLVISVGATVFMLAAFGYIGAKAKNRLVLLIYEIGCFICIVILCVNVMGSIIYTRNITKRYENQNLHHLACLSQLTDCTNCSTIENVMPREICTGVRMDPHTSTWHNCESLENHPVFPVNKSESIALINEEMNESRNGNCTLGLTVIHPSEDQMYFTENTGTCGECPEWSNDDILNYIKTQIQFLGLLSALMCILIIVGLCAASILRKSLKGYQTDSV